MAKRRATSGTAASGGEDAASQGIVEEYLSELRSVRSSGAGVPETSYYPALSNLFNAVGRLLKPKVRCVINLANQGAGLPDGGLFTAEQFQRLANGALKPGQLPSRGAIEVKGTKPEVGAIAASLQVQEYLKRYGIVVVTNLREFAIVERGASGPSVRESFALAESEADFWNAQAAHPRAAAHERGAAFVEFLKRACLHAAPLGNPKDVAWFLASYARDALFRVERQKELPALQSVRASLEEALGMKFVEERGEHFFRSTLVQTLFYGVFSAWVRWHKDHPAAGAKFDWRTAEWSLHVPFIRTLYEEVAKPSRLGPLGLVETLDWAAGVLGRVDRAEFFSRFEDQHAVQYFYEPFLEAYDPELRKELGVWYTPPEIVQYQVARVDRVLREELDLPDGLADPNVIVLDPCCGTGAYLVEVLRTIAATLRDKGGDALVAADLKRAAMNRVFGFEIMPAPFVVSHLQLGLMLQNEGAPLRHDSNERVGVYLTNALTGWAPPKGPKQRVMAWTELQEERDAAEHVKRDKRILVVLGNPPYNAFAGVSPEEEQGLVEPYKVGLNKPVAAGGWGIKKFNLDDLYVRFFRLAERRIAEMSGRGVVSFISNASWISEPSFVVMRQRLLSSFDKFWIENLHGNRKISEYAPDGRTSETVFAIRGFSVGIQQGVATCLWVKSGKRRAGRAIVRFRDDIDAAQAHERRAQLLRTLKAKRFNTPYRQANPRTESRMSFRPEEVAEDYSAWPRIVDLADAHHNGPVERRGNSLIVIERSELSKLRDYLNPALSDAAISQACPAFMTSSGEFKAAQTRAKLKGKVAFDESRIVRYPFKPLDVRFAYLDAAIQPLFSRPSPELLLHAQVPKNRFFITRDTADKSPEGPPFYASRLVCDYDSISGHARHFPVLLAAVEELNGGKSKNGHLFGGDKPRANLSEHARAYLAKLRLKDPDVDPKTAGTIWMHALAIGYSPAYLTENADGIRRDWPRIPLPDSRQGLEVSAALGEQVAALLDTEAEVAGVTTGRLAPAMKMIGPIAKSGGGQLDEAGDDLAVTAGWGHAGKGGVTMPAKGRAVERDYTAAEAAAIAAEAAARGMTAEQATALLGRTTRDVYLNNTAYWRNVPSGAWEYYIGGYQVVKKWLSYRELDLLDRPLKLEEAREVTAIVRRISAILLLQPALDDNYRRVKEAAYPWPK